MSKMVTFDERLVGWGTYCERCGTPAVDHIEMTFGLYDPESCDQCKNLTDQDASYMAGMNYLMYTNSKLLDGSNYDGSMHRKEIDLAKFDKSWNDAIKEIECRI